MGKGGVPRTDVCVCVGGVLCHVTYPMLHTMYLSPHEQTHAWENITFPQLYLWAIIINNLLSNSLLVSRGSVETFTVDAYQSGDSLFKW